MRVQHLDASGRSMCMVMPRFKRCIDCQPLIRLCARQTLVGLGFKGLYITQQLGLLPPFFLQLAPKRLHSHHLLQEFMAKRSILRCTST